MTEQPQRQTSDDRRIIPATSNGLEEAVGRALCDLIGVPQDDLVQGATGAWWRQWDYVAMHKGTALLASLNAAGFDVVKMEAANAERA